MSDLAQSRKNTIFIVLKNADFTEGRGPMLFHSAWHNGEDAIRWVSAQSGIFGSAQRINRGQYGYYAYANGYQIIETTTIESYDDFIIAGETNARREALAKLTLDERRVLGLSEETDD